MQHCIGGWILNLLGIAVFTVFLSDWKDERKNMLIKFRSAAKFPKSWKTGWEFKMILTSWSKGLNWWKRGTIEEANCKMPCLGRKTIIFFSTRLNKVSRSWACRRPEDYIWCQTPWINTVRLRQKKSRYFTEMGRQNCCKAKLKERREPCQKTERRCS